MYFYYFAAGRKWLPGGSVHKMFTIRNKKYLDKPKFLCYTVAVMVDD
jgi:hypothetical protein